MLIYIPLVGILLLIIGVIANAVLNKNQATKFSPPIFLSLYIVYYLIVPFYTSSKDIYGVHSEMGLPYLFWGGFIFFSCFLIGFNLHIKKRFFRRANNLYSEQNSKRIALILFAIAFLCYGIFKGFSLSVFRVQEYAQFNAMGSYNHVEEYLTGLISLFPTVVCLLYASKKSLVLNLVIGVIAVIIYLIGGFRFRLVLFVIPIVVFYHLYPHIKPIKYHIWIPVAILFYILMGVIENTRNYGHGLDISKLKSMDRTDVTKAAHENEFIYYMSAKVMYEYKDREKIYFEPLLTAVCMPIPRAIFPWKPDGGYTRDANMLVFGTIEYGSAFLNYVEAYISFGWIGIILYGLFLGILANIFWRNYLFNPSSIGAILLLSLFNAVLFVIFSRGYMAQALTSYMYYIPVAYWLSRVVRSKNG